MTRGHRGEAEVGVTREDRGKGQSTRGLLFFTVQVKAPKIMGKKYSKGDVGEHEITRGESNLLSRR